MATTVCWAMKGGSGGSVVAAALALGSHDGTLLVDLDGDLPAVLGMPEPDGPGVADWLVADASVGALADLSVVVERTTRLLPRGSVAVDRRDGRWAELAEWLADRREAVIVDAGTGPPPAAFAEAGARSVLVTRACYLSLRRAGGFGTRPDAVVLVSEPGRSLRAVDVERAVGAPVVAAVSVDPAVARAVDAGLLRARLPRGLVRDLRGAA